MRAVRLTGKRKLEIAKQDKLPKPQDNEILINVKAAGICGSDLHIYAGHRPDVSLPIILGHEIAGLVYEIGAKVTQFSVGDRVVIDPVLSCGNCYSCRKGFNNLCKSLKCIGVHIDGGLADYIIVKEENVYKITNNIKWEKAAMIEPFSIAAEVLERSRAKESERVIIFGAGTIGLCILQVLKMKGLKVLITDIVNSRLDKAKILGADLIINSKEKDINLAVEEYTNNEGAELIIDAVGNPKLFEKAIQLVAPGGRILVLGFDSSPANIPEVDLVKKGIEIIGSRLNCRKFPQVISWMNNNQLNIDVIVNAVYSLDNVDKAFEILINNQEDIVKAIVKH